MKAIASHRPLHGLVAAVHTPFHPDGSLAPEVVPLQAAHLAAQGIDTVFITGSTGEAHSLTRDERLTVFEAWAAAAPPHKLRVVAHVGSLCLEDARVFAEAAAGHRCAALAALAPSYYKPNDIDALVRWCATIAEAASALPFYYYDIPSMTGVTLPADRFLAEAVARIPTLAGIKFTNPDLDLYRRCLAFEDGRFDIPWGIDERLIEGLEAGARGAVGSSYNFAAALYQELIAAWRRGDTGTARRLQERSLAMIDAMAAIGYMGAAKAVMEWQGVPVGPVRQPLDNPSPQRLDALKRRFGELELPQMIC